VRRRLADAPELLDAPHHDRAILEQSLDQVAEVNRWLGGTRAVLRAVRPLLDRAATTHLLDLGTGSADIPLALQRDAARHHCDVRIHATDLHPQMRDIARDRTRTHAGISIGAADALALPFRDRSFDVVLLSLTLHHFEHAQQLRALREAHRVARRAVVVNELERGWPNYAGARLLAATRWRGNVLTRHDGPLSVLRAFRLPELARLAADAGVRVERLQRMFFFRLVMVTDARG
jgi:SAM-dependent methyltransferase